MRPLSFVLLVLFLARSDAAESIRITAWNLSPAGTASSSAALNEQRLREVGSALRALHPDVVFLGGLPDQATAEKLAQHLAPEVYKLVVFSSFGQAASGAQLAILSKEPAFAFQAVDWDKVGVGNLPGGFVFAGFRYGKEPVCLYGLQVDDGSVLAREQVSARQLELCAKYLSRHFDWVEQKLTNQLVGMVLTGQLRNSPPRFSDPNLGQFLERTGFRSLSQRVEFNGRVIYPGHPSYPGGSFADAMARNAVLADVPHVGYWSWTEYFPVTYDLLVEAGGEAVQAKGWLAQGLLGRFLSRDWKFWLIAGAAALGGVLVLMLGWYGLRRRYQGDLPAVSNLSPAQPSFMVFERGAPAASASALTNSWETADTDLGLWQRRALRAEQQAEQATAIVRQGVVGHLAEWMKQKLLAGLISQRKTLLDSSRSGSLQLTELEDRLGRVQLQFQERFDAQQQRINELEQEIAAKERVIQEFLRRTRNEL